MMKEIKIGLAIILVIAILYSGYKFYDATKATAKNYAPSIYTHQWQKAMAWVRENTPENAVFGHWWDYGYWLQSIGKRATVLDGGNTIPYWDYLMGRYGLTGPSYWDALEFLYSHNTTHFLIDSTDIGKYGAFSSIGSDAAYDRASYIPALVKDFSQARETKNGTMQVYPGGFSLDSDVVYEQNGSKVFLPAGKSGIAAVIVEFDKNGMISEQPKGVFVYQNKQSILPLRYAYQNKFVDYGEGVEAGIFLMQRLVNLQQGQQMDPTGAMFYLSNRTVKSQLAKLYLYQEGSPYFVKVHDEDDFLIAQIKSSGVSNSSFVFYDQFRGPISIWEIHYPPGMEVNEKYLELNYPSRDLEMAL